MTKKVKKKTKKVVKTTKDVPSAKVSFSPFAIIVASLLLFWIILEQVVSTSYTEPTVWILTTTYFSILLVAFILYKDKYAKTHKKTFFFLFTIPIILSTLYLGGFTVYENIHSVTKGPIHWHADYQVWSCNEKLDLINPRFPSNKIGSPLFHEHNDDRIHIEGTVADFQDIDLDAYFRIIGGSLEPGHLQFNAIDGMVDVKNGDSCNGQPSELAVFINGARYDNFTDYLYYPDSLVPPGDCIIVEFGPNQGQSTTRICDSWDANGWNYQNYMENRING